MKKEKRFNFENSRRISPAELKMYKKAIEQKLGIKLGRPKKHPKLKYKAISIKLDPKIITWAKKEAKKKKVGYQTIINMELLKKAS